jgi:anhydro-N-acetylmuramic acid kinase
MGDDDSLPAFDTGPGNALIDDWVRLKSGAASDLDGMLARAGRVDEVILSALTDNEYFDQKPPKSLDRNTFDINLLSQCSENDGAATLTTVTATSVARGAAFFPAPAQRWLVTGGGRLNPALEAQAFAYLAARSLAGLPLSFPTTTGSAAPARGGRLEKSQI